MSSVLAERPRVKTFTGRNNRYEPYQSKATVLWFNSEKGYGFLKAHKTQQSAFIYHSNIQMEGFRSLEPGDLVKCEIIVTPKGYSAINVVLLQS